MYNLAMMFKNRPFSSDSASLFFYRFGLVLTAIAMPLEIVPNNFLSLLSWVINIFLLQRIAYLLIFKKNNIRLGKKKDKFILAAFLIPLFAIFISAIFSFSRQVAFLELRGLSVLVARCLIIIFFSSKEDIKIFISSIYVVTGLALLFAIFQFYADLAGISTGITKLISNYTSKGTYPFPRVHSVAHEPLYLANYLLISLGLISGDLIINRKNTDWRMKTLFVLSISVIILTVARGAIIGLVLAIVVLLILCRSFEFFKQVILYLLISVFLSLVMLGSASIIKKDTVVNSFGSHAVTTNDESVLNRTSTWKYAIKSLKNNPFTGFGGANSQYFIGESNPSDLNNDSLGLYKIIVFNNSFITFLAEYGFLGLFSLIPLCYLLAIICRELFNSEPKSYAVGVFAFFIAILFQAMTFEILLVMRFWIMLALLIAIWRLQFTMGKKVFKPKNIY